MASTFPNPCSSSVRFLKAHLVSSVLIPPTPQQTQPLDENAAIDVWIARWLRIRRVDLIRRYQCDPRRLYEIWEEKRFPGARDRALKRFRIEYPGLMDRVDFGQHQRIPRRDDDTARDQLALFPEH